MISQRPAFSLLHFCPKLCFNFVLCFNIQKFFFPMFPGQTKLCDWWERPQIWQMRKLSRMNSLSNAGIIQCDAFWNIVSTMCTLLVPFSFTMIEGFWCSFIHIYSDHEHCRAVLKRKIIFCKKEKYLHETCFTIAPSAPESESQGSHLFLTLKMSHTWSRACKWVSVS